MISSQQRIHIIRLQPKQDLKQVLFLFVTQNNIQAAAVVAAVGSLDKANIRLAQGNGSSLFTGPFEIVSLSGTLSTQGLHLHIGLSNSEGVMLGGHLLDGCTVNTTCELVLQEYLDLSFIRQLDCTTGYKELVIEKNIQTNT